MSAAELLQRESFFVTAERKKGPFFVYLHHWRVANKPSFKERGPLSNGCCFHGDRGMKCSRLKLYEWPFCPSPLSSDCPDKQEATSTSMELPGLLQVDSDCKRSKRKKAEPYMCSQPVCLISHHLQKSKLQSETAFSANKHAFPAPGCMFFFQSIFSAGTVMNCLLSLCTSLLLNNRGHGNMSCLTSQPSPAAFY